MESIESEIVQNDYEGLATRGARKKLAKDKYEESKEAAELRSLAQAALLKKEQEEAARKAALKTEGPEKKLKTQRELFIEAEIEDVVRGVPSHELRAHVVDFVQVFIEITKHSSISLKLQFPDGYPDEVVLLDLTSRYLDTDLVEKLKGAGIVEARKLIGERQVIAVIDRVRSILTQNHLAPSFADLKQLKSYLEGQTGCTVKATKEKSGGVSIGLKSGQYILDLELIVPVGYPAKAVEIRSHLSNLPSETISLFVATAKENARRLAELPTVAEDVGQTSARQGAGSGAHAKSEHLSQTQSLASRNRVNSLASQSQESRQRALEKRKELEATFVSQPSLFPLVRFLYEDCLCPLASGTCRVCNKQLLPGDPALVSKIPKSMCTLRLYCGHMYHFRCVESFVSSPPFGKKCLHCDVKIQHSRLMTSEKILEQRWTHQQARQREIEDVAEFMSL